jgi:hypothetical protein
MRTTPALAAMVLVLAGCGYAPNPESGTLRCGPGASCPQGYSCADGLTCWKNGQSPGDGGLPSDGGPPRDGAGGDAGAADKFVGTWIFGATFTKVITCTDGSSSTTNLAGDYVPVVAGTAAPLTADYFCLWNLDLVAAGTSTVIRSGTTCSKTDSTLSPPVTYTWHGQSFTLTTTDGHSGTLDAQLPYDYQSSASTGSCTEHFTGPVSK